MKILLILPMLPRPRGGGAIPVLLDAQIAGLRERNELTVVSSVGDEPGEADAAQRLLESDLDVHIADRRRPAATAARRRRRLRLGATWACRRWPWRTVWFADPGVQTIVDRLAAGRHFDVIVVEDSSMSVFSLPTGAPAVLTEHEAHRADPPRWLSGPLARLPRRLLATIDWRRWDRFHAEVWRRFELIQVYSEGDAEAIAAQAPELAGRVRVNPFGLVLPEPSDPSREREGTVLFVGNFTHPPNVEAALWLARTIMPEVRASQPKARLRIVGTSPPPEVRALACPEVEVVADAASVEPHLEAASLALAPVRSGGGMRMKVLEAMAKGRPVVTTSRGAEGYTAIDPDPPLVIAEGAEGMAAATAALLADPERRRALGARARAFAVEHHSPSAWARRLEAVYAEACGKEAELRRG